MGRNEQFTDDYLLNIIKSKAIELGRTPKKREVKHLNAIINRFGNWNSAIEKANLKVLKRVNYTEDQLIKFIQDKAIELGRIPRKTDFTNPVTITKHFGSFSNAMKRVGMFTELQTDEELFDKLRELKKKLGKTPSIRECEANGISTKIYIFRYKTWNNALRLAGLDINNELTQVTDTNEDVILKYINLCNKLNRLATTRDLSSSEDVLYSKNVFEDRFGSITNLKKLVINDNRLNITDKSYKQGNKKYTAEELRDILLNILKENKGTRLTIDELNSKLKENNLPYINTFYRRFKTTKINELWDIIEDKKE